MPKWVVITGGCGYIGSHISSYIKTHTGLKTLVIDNRARDASGISESADELVTDDYVGPIALREMRRVNPIAVIHCAASSLVTPSVSDPMRYYENNVIKMKKLLDHVMDSDHKNIVFSSSSSVYGDGDGTTPCTESDQLDPISPYGRTKMVGEMMLRDYHKPYGLNSISFRYFNAVGAEPNGLLGQGPKATHLLARIMESVLNDEEFTLHGTDYPTFDGTCIRDYVHVSDVARAHLVGLNHLIENPGCYAYNIGTGRGYSVMQIIDAVERYTGKKVKVTVGNRRPGDPAWRIADVSLIRNDLGWKATNDLEQIVLDAYRWYNSDTFKHINR